ncbi:MAG TPA: hypothetical protein VFH01_09755 [Pyrinomonadaceae bacterium]|nr:hypothetical protein [Pyrinomonadaceae bacterium]
MKTLKRRVNISSTAMSKKLSRTNALGKDWVSNYDGLRVEA